MNRSEDYKKSLRDGLKTIEGQIRGISKMVEEDRYCVDILVQLSAVKARVNKIGLSILDSHTRSCVSSAILEGKGEEPIDELVDIIAKFVK